jgi:serine phosphatase RsbU (regulator of sigma subunit)
LEDNNKNLWFASGNGLAVFNRKKKMFRTYSVEEGLQSNEFNLRACFKSPDGEVFFGGMNGFNSFYPDSLKDNNYIPPIVITSLEKIKAGQKITLHTESLKEISLNYDDYVFTITFAALDYTNPDKNQYAYKMEGLMEDWVEIGNRNFIPFSNIPPGKYILKVKGTNNDGVWNETGTQIRITIRPPWWRSNLAYGIYIIGIVLAIFAFIKIRERNLIKERNILEKKVKKRTIEIEQQKEKIEKAHREITDSINYASRIQTAMLPQCEEFDKNFSDNFIIYKPKDVVSGDFYWINKIKNTTLFAVADCTGHGVPGAFVSMLGISLLNEITNFDDVQHPHQVLEELRRYIKKSLKQIDDVAATKDGMDIAFCAYDTQTHILEYSGANNSIYLIRENYGKNELTELKATKNPIGIYHVEIPFELRSTEILPGDKLYLFSDGFVDQFSENNEKYKIIRLKNKLSEISHLPMNEQKDILEDTFTKWKGANLQIDDVLVVGIQF